MKAVWIDEDNDANYDLLRKHGIDRPYFSHRDPRVTATYLQMVADKGFRPGIYTAWNWYPDLDGTKYAETVHKELIRIGWRGNPPVCVDIEVQDRGYITSFLWRWRKLRPTRETDWTLEGMQAGWFTPQFVNVVNEANIGIAPSFYAGDMTPLPHSVVIDLLMAGVRADKVIGMYDARVLPYRWSGYAFTQGRLPA